MSDERCDVFISYRRDGGSYAALLLREVLRNRGYSVFLDVRTLGACDVNETIIEHIEACKDFLLVCSPGALDKSKWVRIETETAHECEKNIIPIFIEGFSFPENLPESMAFLYDRNGIDANPMHFDSSINRMCSQFLRSKPKHVGQTGEISDSWAEILAAIDEGAAEQRYAVGAWKPVSLGKLGVINMQLAGFWLDERADGKRMAATTWIAKELLPEKQKMLADWKNATEFGWGTSDLRKWLQGTVLSVFPYILRNRLASVKKQQRVWKKTLTGWKPDIQTTEDRLWIPDYSEIFGNDSLYHGLFDNQASNRVKTLRGAAAWWWLRSASYNISSYFYYVHTDGSSNCTYSHYEGGVPLGFCL